MTPIEQLLQALQFGHHRLLVLMQILLMMPVEVLIASVKSAKEPLINEPATGDPAHTARDF